MEQLAARRRAGQRQLAPLVFVCSLVGCATSQPDATDLVEVRSPGAFAPQTTPPPDWVLGRAPIPSSNDDPMVCRSAAVDPEDRADPQQAERAASETARHVLARAFELEILRIVHAVEVSAHGDVDPYVVNEVATRVGEVVRQGAAITSHWRDTTRSLPRPGMTYARACVRIEQPLVTLRTVLRVAYSGARDASLGQEVLERADGLFDRLVRNERGRAVGAAPAPEVES